MIKNRFKDDYSWNARLNGKGRVVDDICYTGTYYILPFTEQEKKKSNWLNMAFAAVLLILQVAAEPSGCCIPICLHSFRYFTSW